VTFLPDAPALEAGMSPDEEMPCSEDAESAFLSACLLDHTVIERTASIVQPEHLFCVGHAQLFTAMREHVEKLPGPINLVTLLDELRTTGKLESVGGHSYLAHLIDVVPTATGAEYYAKIIRECAEARALIRTLEKEAKALRSRKRQPGESAARISDAVLAVQTPGQAEGFVPANVVTKELIALLLERDPSKGIVGVPTGFRDVDDRTGGFREGDFVVLAGVPGSGKTALALQIAITAAHKHNIESAFVSAEMTRTDLVERAVANLARIETHKLRTAQLSPDEGRRMARVLSEISALPLHIDDTGVPDVNDVIARCIALKSRVPGLRLIVVDFIQLLTEGGEENRAEELRAVSYALKGLAKRLRVAIIAACQLNDKTVEARTDKRPTLADLQGSSGMRQAADFIGLCYRPVMYDPMADDTLMQVNVAKARGVATFTVNLEAHLRFMRITDPIFRESDAGGVVAKGTTGW
jgi:replicative DNA helicase